jgi:hypothetical protein
MIVYVDIFMLSYYLVLFLYVPLRSLLFLLRTTGREEKASKT